MDARPLLPIPFALLAGLGLALSPLEPDPPGAAAQGGPVETHVVTDQVAYLSGQGGNVGVVHGPDGVLLVDDQFPGSAEAIEAAARELSDRPIVWVVNTHWHGDHTGGNPHFTEQATIFSHENVRRRLAGDEEIGGRVQQDGPAGLLPEVTYADGVTFHVNGEEVRVVHVARAHTDGDSFVWLPGQDVVITGDLFFQLGYPFVDLDSGGSVQGVLDAVARILELASDGTRIVPGHGEVTGPDGLRAYARMIEETRTAVREALAAGKDADAMVEEDLLARWNERWGGFAFVPPERWIRTLVADLERG